MYGYLFWPFLPSFFVCGVLHVFCARNSRCLRSMKAEPSLHFLPFCRPRSVCRKEGYTLRYRHIILFLIITLNERTVGF